LSVTNKIQISGLVKEHLRCASENVLSAIE